MLKETLLDIYNRMHSRYGPQHWWPAQTRFEMIVGAVLTQSVAWSNVEKAIANLKRADVLKPEAIHVLSEHDLAQMIRPSGYFNVKARKVKAFVEHLARYSYDLDALFAQEVATLRPELLSIHGVGLETADSIILYAACKPVFVVDAYTRRLLPRLGLQTPEADYEEVRTFFEANLPPDVAMFNEYHALIVRHAKMHCQKRPVCPGCPLLEICASVSGC